MGIKHVLHYDASNWGQEIKSRARSTFLLENLLKEGSSLRDFLILLHRTFFFFFLRVIQKKSVHSAL